MNCLLTFFSWVILSERGGTHSPVNGVGWAHVKLFRGFHTGWLWRRLHHLHKALFYNVYSLPLIRRGSLSYSLLLTVLECYRFPEVVDVVVDGWRGSRWVSARRLAAVPRNPTSLLWVKLLFRLRVWGQGCLKIWTQTLKTVSSVSTYLPREGKR